VLKVVLLACLATTTAGVAAQSADAPLKLQSKIALGDVVGRIDHLAIDLKRRRLFVAELGNNSVSVVDLERGVVLKRLTGLREPQGIGYEPEADRVYVANAGDGVVYVFSGQDLAAQGSLKLGEDADNVRIDGPNRLLVGYGEGAIAVIQDGKKVADFPLLAHPESFQSDADRIFVNEPEAQRIAVIDRRTGRELAPWSAPGLRDNFPMALDATGRRLFVAYRHPPTLAMFDTTLGKLVGRISTCGDADDVFFDGKRGRIYVSCGDGSIAIATAGTDALQEIAVAPTSRGSRTALFTPDLDRLYLAVPASGGQSAAIWVYVPQ
jgi:hypothetical protein